MFENAAQCIFKWLIYNENETIKERFLGTIFGQAVGDALGLSTEFMSKQEVDRFYPNGIEDYSQIVQDDHRRRWQRGDWTDDTDMMLCILDSFVACQKVDILDIARRFKEWMMNGGMGIGRHTYNVMALGDYTSNPQKAAEIIWKMGKKKAAANGAVMRTSVVGLMKDNVANAAVAGAILGAKFGICHIPDEWRNGLLYASMLHNKVQDLYFYNHRHSRKVSLMTKNGNV